MMSQILFHMHRTMERLALSHFSTCITLLAVNMSCRQLSCRKGTGRYATLLQDSKACKAKSKIQCRGNIKKMVGPRKLKGRLPSDNPAAALPGYVEKWWQSYWCCWIFEAIISLLRLILRTCLLFRELINPTVQWPCTVDGYQQRIWICYYVSFIHEIFSIYFPIHLICYVLVYEILEWTNNCLSRYCAICIGSNHSKCRTAN